MHGRGLRNHVGVRGRFVNIPQAGHCLILEHRQAVAEAVIPFLREP